MLLVAIQILASRNDLYSNVFEIVIATIQSFLAAALASSNYFCYTAVTSSAIVLILPGYIVLSGSLELASRNITSGSVRMGYSVIYSLFLGFGIAIGAEFYRRITGSEVSGDGRDWDCHITHYDGAPWYLQTVPAWWYFLIVPGYSFWLSLRQSQPILAKELVSSQHVTGGLARYLFPSSLSACNGLDLVRRVECEPLFCQGIPQPCRYHLCHWVSCTPDYASSRQASLSQIAHPWSRRSFCVGLLGNVWGRFFKGTR